MGTLGENGDGSVFPSLFPFLGAHPARAILARFILEAESPAPGVKRVVADQEYQNEVGFFTTQSASARATCAANSTSRLA